MSKYYLGKEIKFIIPLDGMREPKLAVIKLMHEYLIAVCGDCMIEMPEGFMTEEEFRK